MTRHQFINFDPTRGETFRRFGQSGKDLPNYAEKHGIDPHLRQSDSNVIQVKTFLKKIIS